MLSYPRCQFDEPEPESLRHESWEEDGGSVTCSGEVDVKPASDDVRFGGADGSVQC